ncbi:hypothetical protein RIF29_38474 [Crotalaria pallida]|uniref:Non-specific lipid-transfer protein n=1 Tax=Crotalaria pallida TaxID=3830 RepID=A0AAN9E082_CROPI
MKPSCVVASTIPSLVLLLLLLASPPLPYCEAEIECGQMVRYLETCIGYLKDGGASDQPPSTCCDGAHAMENDIKNVDDKRDACTCLKIVALDTKPKIENLRNLLTKCGITLPFEITPDFDCSR